MNKEEVIKLAREAGLTKGQHWNKHNMTTAFMCDFANLVAAHKTEVAIAEAYRCGHEAGVVEEREECAKLAGKTVCDTHIPTGVKIYGSRVADAIRNRGKE